MLRIHSGSLLVRKLFMNYRIPLMIAVLAAAAIGFAGAAAATGPTEVVVYKTASCGCCKKWVEHLQQNGFKVVTHDLDDLSEIKASAGVPASVQTCHTALVGGYVVEGHVPADVIQRLLKEKPKIAGLAVPGMPPGSPGMEGPRHDHFDVLSFDKTGHTAVYTSR